MQHKNKMCIYTIGHSTHSLADFKAILKAYHINQLVDIRSIPRSRHNPQFNFDTFPRFLRSSKIGYRHAKNLGGLRRAYPDSINTAWENASFRGFADYMQTPSFEKGLVKLIQLAQKKTVVIMCGEAVPWRCHRSLIGDALLARGIKVVDIYSPTNAKPHKKTPWAKISGGKITYPKVKK
jgi:uncharacterized protein (DUF488 family)